MEKRSEIILLEDLDEVKRELTRIADALERIAEANEETAGSTASLSIDGIKTFPG